MLLLALAAGCGDEDATRPPPPPPGAELVAAADTYVDTAEPDAAHGASSLLYAGGGRTAYLKFPLEALGDEAVITGARLHLIQVADDPAGAAELTVSHLADDGWLEGTATANAPPGAPDSTFGTASLAALGSGTRRVTVAATAGFAAVAHDWFHGNRILSLQLSCSDAVAFRSTEFAAADAVPVLEIAYETGTRVILEPVADASVEFTESRAYGDREFLAVGSVSNVNEPLNPFIYRTYLKFDLTGLPDDAVLHAAELRMIAYAGMALGGDGNVYTRLVTDDSWTETGTGSYNAPAASVETYGSWWLWYGGARVDQIGINRSPGLLSLVAAERGDGLLSLRLDCPGYSTYYHSREYEEASQRPRLEVLYTR
ncbi:MAG: DNRLRE domain-containing protein [Candidatus Krumholzibacteriia bacterium]